MFIKNKHRVVKEKLQSSIEVCARDKEATFKKNTRYVMYLTSSNTRQKTQELRNSRRKTLVINVDTALTARV